MHSKAVQIGTAKLEPAYQVLYDMVWYMVKGVLTNKASYWAVPLAGCLLMKPPTGCTPCGVFTSKASLRAIVLRECN